MLVQLLQKAPLDLVHDILSRIDNSVATRDELNDLATIVSNKADLARQNKIQESIVDLMH